MQFYNVEMKGEVIRLSVDYAADLFRRLATGAHIIILYSHAAFLTPTNACKVRRPDYAFDSEGDRYLFLFFLAFVSPSLNPSFDCREYEERSDGCRG